MSCALRHSGAEGHNSILLCSEPRIEFLAGLVSETRTNELMLLARSRLENARVSDAMEGVVSQGRTAEVAWIAHDHCHTTRDIVDLISDAVGLKSKLAEQIQVARYNIGGEYRAHFDAYNTDTERGRRCTAVRGQRLLTALLYLNGDFAGGNTVFPRLNIEVVPSRGALLIFENCQSSTCSPHPHSLHAGAPVTAGEKWIASVWYRER